jgi:ABC-type multidrug transport system ATPase subunit
MQLVIDGVGKCYGSHWGLRGFSAVLSPGVVGLLGPNGAGKSTLMRMLATVSRPSEGRIAWNGVDTARNPDALRAELGYLPQDFGVYPQLTAVEFLAYLAAAKGLPAGTARARIDALLDLVNLGDARHRPLGGFSGGMRQRVGIAQALLTDPALLIVDEPTAGLDPEERVRLRNLLADLAGERIVMLSTHVVSDIEAIATDLLLVAGGRLQRRATPEELLRDLDGKVWSWTVPSAEVAAQRDRHLVAGMIRRSDGVQLRIVAPVAPHPSAIAVAPNLEDAYLATLGRDAQLPSEIAA